MPDESIFLATHAFSKSNQHVYLKDEVRRKHCHIIGGTGTGKSKLMEHMIRQDIRNGKGICLIDPHGNLFESVLKWCLLQDYRHRLVVIDPNQSEWSVGLNFLEYDSSVWDLGQHVENVIDDLGKARDEDLFQTAQVVIWLRYFLQLAAVQNPPLAFTDLYALLDDRGKDLRLRLTDTITDPVLRQDLLNAWNEYDTAPARTRSEFMRLPVWSRIQTFLGTKNMRRIVGQTETTVDFYGAMQKNRIVLVNLSGQLTEHERNLLGIVIIEKIFEAAKKRKPDREKQYYVYIDEFGYFVSERIAQALEELRKRHVGFILAHQELEQLKDDSRIGGNRLLASVMTNTKVKIAFRVSREDAEAMALEMFAGFITGDEVKHEQKTISFWPHKTREKSFASGTVISEGDIQSFSNMIGQASTQIAGQVYVPGSGFLPITTPASSSEVSGMSSSYVRGDSRGTVSGYAQSDVEINVPFYDLEPFEQVVSTTFYSIEEVKERFIQFLQNQQERFFHLRILGETDQPPIALQTPTVDEVFLLPSVLQYQTDKILERYARNGEEVEKEIEQRRIRLLNFSQEEAEEEDDQAYNPEDYE